MKASGHQRTTVPGSHLDSSVAIHVSRVLVIRTMVAVAVSLAAAHLGVNFVRIAWPTGLTRPLWRLFDVGQEANLPTFFSAISLLLAAVLLAPIAAHEWRTGGRWWKHWTVLAVGFALMSVDEAAMLHDGFVGQTLRLVLGENRPSVLQFPWVLPACVLVAAMAVMFLPFLRALPGRYRRLFVTAAVVYVGSAIGLEIVESVTDPEGGSAASLEIVRTLAEEAGEMAGVIILLHAVLCYLEERRVTATISVSPLPAGTPASTGDVVDDVSQAV